MALTKTALAQMEADYAKSVASRKQASAAQLLAEQKPVTPTKEQKLASLDKALKGPFQVGADGRIDCTFVHPTHGDLPFTADPDDPEEHGRLIYELAQKRATQ